MATQLVQDLDSVRDRIPQLTLPHQSQPRLRVYIAAMDRALNPRRRNGNKALEPVPAPPGNAPQPSKAAV